MSRSKKKAPRPEGEIGAPIIEPIIEEKREEKREKYTVHAISDEEYRAFGNTNRKSEIKEVAEDIIKRVLESKTPLMIKFHDIKVRQIIPVLARLIAEYKTEYKIEFKASVKENALAIKRIPG